MATATRTKRQTTDPRDHRVSDCRGVSASDPRDKHPLFTAYVAAWTEQINANPNLAALPPKTRESYAAQMARSSVRFDETVTHRS